MLKSEPKPPPRPPFIVSSRDVPERSHMYPYSEERMGPLRRVGHASPRFGNQSGRDRPADVVGREADVWVLAPRAAGFKMMRVSFNAVELAFLQTPAA